MANFNFTVQDLKSTDGSNDHTANPFFRENTKDLPNGKQLSTSGSFSKTKTFNPNVGSSLLSVGQMMMGPAQFASQSTTLKSTLTSLTSAIPSSRSAGTHSNTPDPNGKFGNGANSANGTTDATGTSNIPQLAASSANAGKINVVMSTANSLIGTMYQWGGGNVNGPTLGSDDGNGQVMGYDCSGFVLYCFNKAGLVLDHLASSQYQATSANEVPVTGTLLEGDLLFFGPAKDSSIHHVAIAIDNESMIEAPHSNATIAITNTLRASWRDLVAATRPFPLPPPGTESELPMHAKDPATGQSGGDPPAFMPPINPTTVGPPLT